MNRLCPKCGGDERNKFDQCFPCKRAANAKHRAKTRKEAVERTKRWQQANPEKRAAHAKLYRVRHPEKVQEMVRLATAAWRRANPEKVKQDNARWYANHPEARRLKNHNRAARAANGKISRGLTGRLLELQRGCCAVCRDPLKKYHLDHVMPLALGGKNEDSNIQLLCPPCNLQKHAKHPIVFMQSRGFLL